MTIERRLVCAVVTSVLLLGLSQAAQTPVPQKIKLLTLLGQPLQLIIAERRGYLAEHGVAVETENLASSELLRSTLAAGGGDLAYLAVDNAVAMAELAHQDVMILMG